MNISRYIDIKHLFKDIHIFLDNQDQIKSLFPPKLPAELLRNDAASFGARQNKALPNIR